MSFIVKIVEECEYLKKIKDVFNILNNTELDSVIIENYYITKHSINNEYYSPLLVKTINNEV